MVYMPDIVIVRLHKASSIGRPWTSTDFYGHSPLTKAAPIAYADHAAGIPVVGIGVPLIAAHRRA